MQCSGVDPLDFRLNEEEILKFNQSNIVVPEGQGFMGS